MAGLAYQTAGQLHNHVPREVGRQSRSASEAMPSFSWIPALVVSSFVLQSINAHEPESNPFPLEPCNGVVIKDVTVAVLQEVQTHPITRTNNQYR